MCICENTRRNINTCDDFVSMLPEQTETKRSLEKGIMVISHFSRILVMENGIDLIFEEIANAKALDGIHEFQAFQRILPHFHQQISYLLYFFLLRCIKNS